MRMIIAGLTGICALVALCDARAEGFSNGEALVRAMHARYVGKWYPRLKLEQDVTYYRDGKPERHEVWNELLELPGKVRSTIGDAKDGNAEIYVTDTVYYVEKGKVVRQKKAVHTVLLLGFDVYVHPPEKTIQTLESDGMNLGVIRADTWQGRPVWVVGAQSGDNTTPQFWIEQERLLLVRAVRKSASGFLVDVQIGGYEPLGGGWVATEFAFYRDGQPFITEKYRSYSVPESIDPATFDASSFKTLP